MFKLHGEFPYSIPSDIVIINAENIMHIYMYLQTLLFLFMDTEKYDMRMTKRLNDKIFYLDWLGHTLLTNAERV